MSPHTPPQPFFPSQYNSWMRQTGLKKEIIVLGDNAAQYSRQTHPTPSVLCQGKTL